MPDVVLYTDLFSACDMSKKLGQTLVLLKAMEQQAVVPDAITYNTLISACEKGKDFG